MDITTNTVTSLQTTCSRENIIRLFYKFADKYGAAWTTRLGSNPDWERCLDDWFLDLKKYEYKTLLLATKSALSQFKNYPPTFGQFDNLCKKHSGFLQFDDAIKMLIDRDFSHPIVKIMYDRIGSWALTNGTQQEVQAKCKEVYADAEVEFTLFPDKCWNDLELYNAKPKELPLPDKIPNSEERKGFKQRMAEYQKIADESKEKLKDNSQPQFDSSKLNPVSRSFDKLLYDEYRMYLLGIPENRVLSLSVQDAYARMRFISMIEQETHLKKAGYVPENQRIHKEQDTQRSNSGKPERLYKSWSHD